MVQIAPTLIGDGLVLRELRDEDRPALRSILAEESVARWWGTRTIDESVDDLYDPGVISWVIEVEGIAAGSIQAREENEPDYRHAGIDLFLAGAYQGRGIGPAAIRLVVRHLVERRGHHRLTIDPSVANRRAIRAYEQVGFRPVGVMRRYERGPDGTWHDGLLMDLLAEELPRAETAQGPGEEAPG